MSRCPPPRPPPRPSVPKRPAAAIDPLARALAKSIRDGHGAEAAATLDMSESLGSPRWYIGTLNIALERALGCPGIPAGRLTEISGWEGAGKSTVLDQIISQCQAEGGLAVLADVERARNRAYMVQLGCKPESIVWIRGNTVETMFAQIETLVRDLTSRTTIAWWHALLRAGIKCPAPRTKKYEIFDQFDLGDNKRKPKPVHVMTLHEWGRQQAAALMEWQKREGLPAMPMRDPVARERLRPCVLLGETDAENEEAEKAWIVGESHPLVQPANRHVVIGWDSVASTPTDAEMEGDSRDQHPATAARVIRRNLRRLVQLIDDEAIAFVLINQRYAKIMQGWQPPGASKSETYGGGGIKYHSTIRIELDKIGEIYPSGAGEDTPPMGQIVRIKVPKNKIESPFHEEEFGLIFGRGADNAWAIYEDLKARGVILVKGGWSSFVDPKILGKANRAFHGWQELSNIMAEDSALWAKLSAMYAEAR